jgi:hypothetical protein
MRISETINDTEFVYDTELGTLRTLHETVGRDSFDRGQIQNLRDFLTDLTKIIDMLHSAK